jgi:hypothetical protein
MSITGNFTWPTTRESGVVLSLSEIAHGQLLRDGVEIQILTPDAAQATWADMTTSGIHDNARGNFNPNNVSNTVTARERQAARNATGRQFSTLTSVVEYTVRVVTKDGAVSALSNAASVTVGGSTGSDPASAVTDLTAVVNV